MRTIIKTQTNKHSPLLKLSLSFVTYCNIWLALKGWKWRSQFNRPNPKPCSDSERQSPALALPLVEHVWLPEACSHFSHLTRHFVRTHQIHFLLLRLPSTEGKKRGRVTKLERLEIALESRANYLDFRTKMKIRTIEEWITCAVVESHSFYICSLLFYSFCPKHPDNVAFL